METKGKTLEEIDALFDGQKHSNVPDIEQVRKGTAQIDTNEIERELDSVVETAKLE